MKKRKETWATNEPQQNAKRKNYYRPRLAQPPVQRFIVCIKRYCPPLKQSTPVAWLLVAGSKHADDVHFSFILFVYAEHFFKYVEQFSKDMMNIFDIMQGEFLVIYGEHFLRHDGFS